MRSATAPSLDPWNHAQRKGRTTGAAHTSWHHVFVKWAGDDDGCKVWRAFRGMEELAANCLTKAQRDKMELGNKKIEAVSSVPSKDGRLY